MTLISTSNSMLTVEIEGLLRYSTDDNMSDPPITFRKRFPNPFISTGHTFKDATILNLIQL
jgi:hypothetical protein